MTAPTLPPSQVEALRETLTPETVETLTRLVSEAIEAHYETVACDAIYGHLSEKSAQALREQNEARVAVSQVLTLPRLLALLTDWTADRARIAALEEEKAEIERESFLILDQFCEVAFDLLDAQKRIATLEDRAAL